MKNVILGVPAYNEEETIGSVVSVGAMFVDDVIVVDDGSTDRTCVIAELSGADVFRLGYNHGKGYCVRKLIEIAKNKESTLVLIDGDFQHDPFEVEKLLEKIDEGYDIVIGKRERFSIPLVRRIGNKILGRATLKHDIDTQSGFRVLSRHAVSELCDILHEDGFGIESEMIKVAKKKGLLIDQVCISVRYHNGHSKNFLLHGLSVLTGIFRFIIRREPLRVFGFSSLISFLIALMSGIRVVSVFSKYGVIPLGTAFVMLLSAIYAGFLISLGLILNVFRER